MCSMDELKEEINKVEQQVKSLQNDVQELVTLVTQAKGVLVFIKWTAAIIGTFAASYIFVKTHLLR